MDGDCEEPEVGGEVEVVLDDGEELAKELGGVGVDAEEEEKLEGEDCER